MSKELYQHFATEDIPFIDKGLEWLSQVEEHYAPILSPFINPILLPNTMLMPLRL